MSYAVIFTTLAICLIVGALSAVFGYNKNLLSFIMRILSSLAILILALVSANLSASFGGYTIFITIAIAFSIAQEAFILSRNQDRQKAETLVLGITNALCLLCVLAAGITLIQFNLLGLAFGLLLGLGISCIVALVKKLSLIETLMICINLTLGSLILGQTLALLIAHFVTAISVLFLLASLVNLFTLFYSTFAKENKTTFIITQVAKLICLTLLAFSIFFMV